MNRSAGVTVIAVLAFVGSAIALAIAGLLASKALSPPENFAGSPVLFRTVLVIVPFTYALSGVWGIVSGVGLLQLKNWARISTIVFASLLTVFGTFSALGFLLSLTVPPTPGADKDVAALGRNILGVFTAAQLAIGIWWLAFLNRARVRDQFKSHPVSPFAPGSTAYAAQASYQTPPPPPLPMAVMPAGRKRPLSVSIIAWFVLVGCAFVPINLALHTPAALFLWMLNGWQAAAFYLVVGAVLIYLGVGLLRLDPYARTVGIAYFSFAVANSAVFYFALGRRARMMRIFDFQQSMFPAMRTWQETFPQPDPMLYLWIGGAASLVLSIAIIYFLAANKHAFRRAASS
jgi:hypothetical protein